MKSFRIFGVLVVLAMLVSFGPASAAPAAAPASQPQAPSATAVSLDPFSTGPSYDSGWRSIDAGQTLSMWHGLGKPPALMLVYLETLKYGSPAGIEQRFIGGNDLGSWSAGFGSANNRVGAYWHNLTGSYILVTRMPEDTALDAVRVRIWGMGRNADYSAWVTVSPGQYTNFIHNLGGNVNDYVVDMVFNDTSTSGLGVNQRAYGGRTLGTLSAPFNDGSPIGAYWRKLDSVGIVIDRLLDDTYADEILLRIWQRQKPTYDSGWVSIAQGDFYTFNHHIGGSANDYRVDMEFKSSSDPWSINQCFYGGNDFGPQSVPPSAADNGRVGAYWYGLNIDSITVSRRPEDSCADQVRIRIWNFWTPTLPDYDSDWRSITPDVLGGFTPGITGGLDPYMVDLQFKDSGAFGIGIHQRGLGGMDWTNGDRLGASWYYTSGTMLFLRRTEDEDAAYIRARIWKMPKPAFDSGWQDIADLYSIQFIHNLGGNPADFLVDVQFKDSGGYVHQVGYGGYEGTHIDEYLGDRLGGYWDGLDDTRIYVHRQPEETGIDQVRARIWTLARPHYDSGMVAATTISTALTHDLGGRTEDYLLNLVFNNTTGPKQLHQMYYGGAVIAYDPPAPPNQIGDTVGGFYRQLSSASVQFVRHAQDPWIDEFRLRIWLPVYKTFISLVKKN